VRSEHKTTGDEYDAFTDWRHYLCYLQRAGVRKAIKRDSHRKDRAVGKALTKEQKEDWLTERREEG
jgi:hypothetical protein